MEKKRSGLRRPDAGEQEILDGLEIRPISLEETGRFNEQVAKHHYLKSSILVGEHMRYVATFEGEWFALGAWSAGALHLKGRDGWIGWNDEQRHRRLPLVANNARLLGLPGCEVPNLMSRFMKGMLTRLSAVGGGLKTG